MSAHAAPVDRRKQFRARMWLSAVLATFGALLLVLGSCSSATPPPAPNSANAGSIDGEASAVSSSPQAATSSEATTPASTSSAEPSTATSSARPTSSAPVPTSSAKPTSSSSTASGSPTIAPPSNTVVLPSFEPVEVKGPILEKSAPVTLTIPAIGVTDSPVLDMGIGADGLVEVPPLDDTKSSGWYDRSPTPGELGPSILLGHVDSRANGPSVFYKLGDLKPGDEIEVAREDGSVAVFKVDGVREYSKAEFPTRTVYGNLDHAGLRLITCGGAFNSAVGHYESNVIAFATLVSSRQA